jgi:hypothetical protein
MGRIVVLLCLLLVPIASAEANDAEDKYQVLLQAAKDNPATVDWQALRFAYADCPDFDLLGDASSAARHDMFQAFEDGNFPLALAQARVIINRVYVDIEAHRIAAIGYKHAGDLKSFAAEKSISESLMNSVMTGDGLTPKTAYTVISVQEEYELLHALGLKVTRQALAKIDSHAYDVMTTEGHDGVAGDYYFLIDRVLAAEARALSPQQ